MTYIIAEIGINHNGSLKLAKDLIDAARWCGADAVKFQKRTIEIVYKGQLDTPRESPWGATLEDQKAGLEFGRLEYDEINDYCRKIRMPWFASAWDIYSLNFLKPYDLPYNKIASAMAINKEFLKAVKEDSRKVILSTAMCDEHEIWEAANTVNPICIMHCVGTYPAKEEDLNLSYITRLIGQYAPIKIGYSGHETSVSPSVTAVALGAEYIERHLTLDRSMYGSDQAASLEPIGFWNMVNEIRKLPKTLGDGQKHILDAEKVVAKKLKVLAMIPVFITVRTASTRLPNKCLMDFGETSVIGHVIKRCQFFELSPIVCTTTFKSDDILEDIAHGFGVDIFRGSIDPHKRWFDCARVIGCDAWHSLDCDDPFFCSGEVKRSYDYLQDEALHCVLPTKTSAGGAALMGTSWSTRQGETKILPEYKPFQQYRMTLDYPEDYWFLRTLVRCGFNYKTPRRDLDFQIDSYGLTKINSFRTADWKANQHRELVT